MTSKTVLTIAFAAGLTGSLVAPSQLAAATSPSSTSTITYTASGTLATPAVSGADTLRLAGEPFSVSISVPTTAKPAKTGKNWALYTMLKLTGTVHSGLLGSSPINIVSGGASIQLFTNPSGPGLFIMGAPIKVVGLSLTIKSNITLPANTITSPLAGPFTTVQLAPANANMVYFDSSADTTLGIQSGTLSAAAAAQVNGVSPVILHPAAMQAVTRHADGTESFVSGVSAPVDMGQLSDGVTLKFYASGVSGASDVSMQIAGESVPVLYAGPSGHYAGLDEVYVQLPRSLAGRGATEAVLTVDGVAASPVAVSIQ